MRRRLLTWIQNRSSWPVILGLLSAVGGLAFMMNGTNLPFSTPTIEDHSAGLRILDMRVFYGPEEANELFEALGAEGRRGYLLLHLMPDIMFPACYSLAFACTSAWFLVRLLPAAHRLQWLALTPLISGLADILENLSLVVVNTSYPRRVDWLAHIASLLTTIKWGLMPIGVVLLSGMAVLWLFRGRPQGSPPVDGGLGISAFARHQGVAAPREVALSSRAGRAVLAAAVCGSALAYMSDDMLNVALPSLADDLGVGVSSVQWVVNGYFVTMLSLMLVAGSVGDNRGHRRTFLDGLAVFTAGAFMCALAPTVPILVGGRAIQGIGAALVLASGLALVNGSFPEAERSRAIGLYMGSTAVFTAVGPLLGGLLIDTISWRSIFVAPLVFPALGAAITFAAVREAPTKAGRSPDGKGTALAFLMISSFSVALIRGPHGWFAPEVLAAIGLTVVGGGLFLISQRRAADPMLPLGLFDNSTFVGGNVVTLLAFTASAGSFFFVVIHLQNSLGFDAAKAGAALVPLYVIMVIGSPLSGALADKIGPVVPIAAGLVVFAAGAWWLSAVQGGADYLGDILPGVVILAVGLAALGAPLTAATLGAAGEGQQGIASGINNTFGQLAGLLMIAALPAAVGLSDASLEGPEFAEAYQTAMRICAALAVASAVIATITIRPKSSSLRPGETLENSSA